MKRLGWLGWVGLLLGLPCAGCVHSNQEWLNPPEDSTSCVDGSCDREPDEERAPDSPLSGDDALSREESEAPARLARTDTLGGVVDVQLHESSGPQVAAPTVVVNQYQQVAVAPQPQVGYWAARPVGAGYYAGRGSEAHRTPSTTTGTTSGHAATPSVAGDWPRVPSYGPRAE